MRIRAVGSDGAGVGDLPDGRVIFVHRTGPGDEVEVQITQSAARWARGEVIEVVRAGPRRAVPACPHYAVCGGCTLQHLPYSDQLAWKARFLSDALERIGGIEAGPESVVPSPASRHYRSRMTFTLLRLPGDRVVAGLHHRADGGRVVDVGEGCVLPEPAVLEAWRKLRASWGAAARRLPAGKRLRLTLRGVDEGVILVVEGGRGPGRPDVLLREVDDLVAVWSVDGRGALRLLGGRAETGERQGGEPIRTSPTDFLQVNRAAADLVERRVLEAVAPAPGLSVVDAYCGVGPYGRRIARAGGTVVGIELDPRTAETAASNAPRGFSVLAGSVEERLADALPADVAILNPPRAGLGRRVAEVLAAAGPPRLVYVSCDPATLARDLAWLGSAYVPHRDRGLRPLPPDGPRRGRRRAPPPGRRGRRGLRPVRYWATVRERTFEVEIEGDAVRLDGRPLDVEACGIEATHVHSFLIGHTSHRVVARRSGPGAWDLHLRGRRERVEVLDERTRKMRKISGRGERAPGPRPLRAPMPGLVVKVGVREGEVVDAGAGLLVMEAMKMENELRAQTRALVGAVLVTDGQPVDKGQVLVELLPAESQEAEEAT